MSEERRSHFATIRVELEDSTDEEASWFWEAIQGGGSTIERDPFEASIVRVEPDKLSILGRERALMNTLTSRIRNQGVRGYSIGPVSETRRGCVFEVQIVNNERGKYVPTGHYARVEVTLDRFDADEAKANASG